MRVIGIVKSLAIDRAKIGYSLPNGPAFSAGKRAYITLGQLKSGGLRIFADGLGGFRRLTAHQGV
jgi:hypothetical protein